MKKKKVNLRDIDTQEHSGEHTHDGGHNHSGPENVSNFRTYLPAIFSFVMLIAGIGFDYFEVFPFFKGWLRIAWYVVFLAIGLTFLPYFFVEEYIFSDWLYRALIFLVISCPCALVISIPLGYFGGLGAASRNGILFKGASFLDAITKVNTVVMDKTGTVTKGVFKIKEVVNSSAFTEAEFMKYQMAMEEQSTHRIAKAILEYKAEGADLEATNVSEVAGKGLKGTVNGKTVLVGNKALMTSNGIQVPSETDSIVESIVIVAIDGKFAGYVTIADELKEDAHQAIKQIRESGISKIIMLSGDKDSITQQVAKELNIDWGKGGMLPEDEVGLGVSLQPMTS